MGEMLLIGGLSGQVSCVWACARVLWLSPERRVRDERARWEGTGRREKRMPDVVVTEKEKICAVCGEIERG